MADHIKNFLPRFRYGMIRPRAQEGGNRGAGYQFYRLVPLDVMEFSAVIGLTNYTREAVEAAMENYWKCVDALVQEKAQNMILAGAPVCAALGRKRVLDLLRQTSEKTGIPTDASLESLIASMKHLGLTKLAIGSRWADKVNDAMASYLTEGGIEVVGITKRNQWSADAAAMSLEEGMSMSLDVGREAALSFPQAEAISVPGGAALCLHVIPALEEEFAKPVFTNISTEVWNNLVRPGIIKPVQGWGRLLANE